MQRCWRPRQRLMRGSSGSRFLFCEHMLLPILTPTLAHTLTHRLTHPLPTLSLTTNPPSLNPSHSQPLLSSIASGQRPQERQDLPPELMIGCKVCRKVPPKPVLSTQPRPRGVVPVGPIPSLSSPTAASPTARSDTTRGTTHPPFDRQDSSPRSSDSKGVRKDNPPSDPPSASPLTSPFPLTLHTPYLSNSPPPPLPMI